MTTHRTGTGDDAIDAELIETAFQRLSPLHQNLLLCTRIERRTYEEVERLLGFTKRGCMREMARAIYWLSCHIDDILAGRRPSIAMRIWRWLWQL